MSNIYGVTITHSRVMSCIYKRVMYVHVFSDNELKTVLFRDYWPVWSHHELIYSLFQIVEEDTSDDKRPTDACSKNGTQCT